MFTWIILIALLTAAVIGLPAAIRRLEPRLAFRPTAGEKETPADWGLEFEALSVETSDGLKLRGWRLPHPQAVARVVFFHGNRGNLSFWAPFMVSVREKGLEVIAFDYRGYGLSQGLPSELGLYRDCRAIVGWLKAQEPAPTVFWGRSLGGFTAAFAASLGQPAGLILEAAFPSKKRLMAKRSWGWRILSLFSRYRLETAVWLAGFRGPVLLLHGDSDTVVPPELGLELSRFAAGESRFHTIAGAGHGNLHEVGQDEYWELIGQFFEDIGYGFNQHQRDRLRGATGRQAEGEEEAPEHSGRSERPSGPGARGQYRSA